jgi:hypothetical protein
MISIDNDIKKGRISGVVTHRAGRLHMILCDDGCRITVDSDRIYRIDSRVNVANGVIVGAAGNIEVKTYQQ